MVEQGTENPCVVGPTPTLATIHFSPKTRKNANVFGVFLYPARFTLSRFYPLLSTPNHAHIMPNPDAPTRPDAEAMERSGADRLAIWRETGWWRG